MEPKFEYTKVCMTLGHSNWTNYNPRNLFLKSKFTLEVKYTASLVTSRTRRGRGRARAVTAPAVHSITVKMVAAMHNCMSYDSKRCMSMTLEHSNWTIRSPQTYFCRINFHFCNSPHAYPDSCMQPSTRCAAWASREMDTPQWMTERDDTEGCDLAGEVI